MMVGDLLDGGDAFTFGDVDALEKIFVVHRDGEGVLVGAVKEFFLGLGELISIFFVNKGTNLK